MRATCLSVATESISPAHTSMEGILLSLIMRQLQSISVLNIVLFLVITLELTIVILEGSGLITVEPNSPNIV